MNRINTLALTLVGTLALLFSSCEKAPFITMTGPRSFNFTRDGGSQSITFSCNRPWSVSSTESWVQITPSSGEASDKDITVTIKCSPNTTYDPRSATVTVKLEELSESITITQDTGIGLLVSPTTFELTNAAQVIEIEVQKNVQYSVAIDDESAKWIKQGGTKALTTDKVTFTISANESYDNREGKITFKQLDGDLSQTVTIRQSQTNGLFITTPDYNLSNEAHTLSVEVKANVEFEVTSQTEWIKYVETKALTPSTITLSVEVNESYDNRTGTVLVKQKNGDLEDVITIAQSGRIPITGLLLSRTTIAVVTGTSTVLTATVIPENTTEDKTISWFSSDDNIVMIENGTITGRKAGSAIISASIGGISASCSVRVQDLPEGAINLDIRLNDCDGMEYLLFWGQYNLGASNQNESGVFYSWGEIEKKANYSWNTYKWCNGDISSLTKYNTYASYGIVDNITVLEAEDDVAHVKLGGNWRIPTGEDWRALLSQCSWEWSTNDGYSGWRVSGKNGNYIFLPAVGCWEGDSLKYEGTGEYWSSSLFTGTPFLAVSLRFYTNSYFVASADRSLGLAIRPVTE